MEGWGGKAALDKGEWEGGTDRVPGTPGISRYRPLNSKPGVTWACYKGLLL